MINHGFHISQKARFKYKFDESYYSPTGNLIVNTPAKARIVAGRINEVRKQENEFDNLVTPGEVNALALLHEVYHLLIRNYEENQNPGVFKRGIEYLKSSLDERVLNEVLLNYIIEFPPVTVQKGIILPGQYLSSSTGSKSNKEIILEELILLHFENINPAAAKLNELFDDRLLKEKTKYRELITKTEEFFEKEKPTGFGGLHLFSILKKPISANPYNLELQLEFIRSEWGNLLPVSLIKNLLRAKDLIKEEYRLFTKHDFGSKPTPPVPKYDIGELGFHEKRIGKKKKIYLTEAERFTEDTDWMPSVVMIAKNVYVWMHQLSEKYGRQIKRLDEIPDEELDLLAEWNFTALWLIGLWERSSASEKIKKLTGNTEAAASAYSLYDYEIAGDLGGDEAFENFKQRALLRGIRLASDMVPNHTGIYSRWIIEKPDYYIQTDTPPFPSYKFTGPNLSEDSRVEIRIEDKYYTREDAAVVFEWKETATGRKRYIYHGNDGTHMPWNDTAQLNLLNPETRESLIQIIEHVARKTPIIRFDAAMTLTQKHYQRLWFPEPGEGGAIPSRSDFSMTKEEFIERMPNEFWREVVDRINNEMPNTLLLAEAFWLMEGYFVRTLGMHRVYNSAFMHMFMKEENDKYRQLIINTLQFNPEILKRYVNFISNPDEETAANQFGKGDKYFGVAVMMVTLPGLPMFGHGQIEGFTEKYGMEYKRSYYDEEADEHLIWRHKREIFPLLKLRRLFSQVENFEFYNFKNENGNTLEDIFVFSNRQGSEKALVVYNNSYSTYSGSIKYSVPRVLTGNDNGKIQPEKHISEILNIKNNDKFFYIYNEHRTGLQFLLSGKEVNQNGIELKLFGYQYRVCLNFVEVYDEEGKYKKLYDRLNGRGVTSVDEAILEMDLSPLHSAFEELLAPPNIRKIRNFIFHTGNYVKGRRKSKPVIPESVLTAFREFVKDDTVQVNPEDAGKKFEKYLNRTHDFYQLWIRYNNRKSVPKWMKEADEYIPLNKKDEKNDKAATFSSFLTLRSIQIGHNGSENILSGFDSLLLKKPLRQVLRNHYDEDATEAQITLLKSLLIFDNELKRTKIKFNKRKDRVKNNKSAAKKRAVLQKVSVPELLSDPTISNFIMVNEFKGVSYFNKERYEEFINWLLQIVLIKQFLAYEKTRLSIEKKKKEKKSKTYLTKQELERQFINAVKTEYLSAKNLIWLAEECGYDLEKLKNSLIKIKSKNKKEITDED